MKRSVSIFIAACMLSGVTLSQSCGSTGDNTETTTTSAGDTTTAAEDAYQHPDVDYGGAEFRILNLEALWDMFIHIDRAEINGEVLNDAVYNRNRKLEQQMNFVINEITQLEDMAHADLITLATNSILAGDDMYDVMFLPVNTNLSIVTDGYLVDLNSLPQLNLDETWWDTEINKQITLHDKLYMASGAMNLMAYEGTWCLYFNENMIEDLQLERPYDLVREGNWTIDRLSEYAKAAASLNGDDSFAYKKDGSATWGIAAHSNAPQKFVFCAGESSVDFDENDDPVFNYGSERFYNVISKLAVLLSGDDGQTLEASTEDFDAELGGYLHVFSTGRSLFVTGEIKAAQTLRDMTDTFGIIPFPKYDESQEDYVTDLVLQLFYLTIPITNQRLDMTATIVEAMTHDSFTDVIPVYYEQTVEQKGLRNDESIEMLEIMRQTRTVDPGVVFGWTNTLNDTIRVKLFAGDANVASDIESAKTSIETNIDKFLEFLEE